MIELDPKAVRRKQKAFFHVCRILHSQVHSGTAEFIRGFSGLDIVCVQQALDGLVLLGFVDVDGDDLVSSARSLHRYMVLVERDYQE